MAALYGPAPEDDNRRRLIACRASVNPGAPLWGEFGQLRGATVAGCVAWGRWASHKRTSIAMKAKILLIAAAASAALFVSNAQAAGVVNGDFELGNTGFTSGYGYLAPAGQHTLYPEGYYTVDKNPNNVHDLWSSFGDHTSGAGEMMIVNGAPTPDVTVWSETVTGLSTNTTYYFSAWVASSYPTNPAVLNFSINGDHVDPIVTPSTTPGVWSQFYTTWNSGAHTSAVLGLVNENTVLSGNDFVLDDIAFGTTLPGGVPEPASWALMIGGFGLAGAALRRRRATAAA
jgi:hypothetical protein